MPPSPVARLPLPSTWFTWHDYLITKGSRVLDLACGEGRHSVAAALKGATVTALDKDETEKLGKEGFDKMAKKVEALEKRIGINDLSVFTPKS